MSAQAGEGNFTGHDGLVLFRRWWRPEEAARAVLVNVHGLGDHSGLYPTLSSYFPARGVALHALDLRGNGHSPGRRGHVDRWSQYREDLHAFIQVVAAEEPGLPLFLLGNSLGGLIVLDYALHHPRPLRGVIAVAPPLGRLGVPPPLLLLGRVASRIWPRLSLRTGMDLTGLARDPEVVRTVLADPLFHRLGSARLSTEVTAALARVQARAPEFPLPLLLLHGGADRMVPPEGSRAFAARVGHPDHTLREYPGGYHCLFADFDRDVVLADLGRWMEAHL